MKAERSPAVSRKWAFFALGALIFLLLVPLPRPMELSPFVKNIQNLLHVPLFMAVTILLRTLPSSPLHRRPVWVCAVAAALLGVISEMLQGLTGRTPAVEDLGADLAGILLACVVLLRGGAHRMALVRLLLLLAGGGMLALAAGPLVEEVSVFAAKRKRFPVLMDPEVRGGLWQPQGATRLSESDGGLVVETARGDYEGLRYAIPPGVATSGYSGLEIEADNEAEGFELCVRIDTVSGGRKYAAVVIPRGKSVLDVGWEVGPGDGGLRRVVLFTGVDQPARKFRLLDVRLVGNVPIMEPGGP